VAGIDWENVARAATHPLRLRIMERAAADPGARFSPVELAGEFGAPLGNVSYHTRALLAQGLIVRAGTKTVRGAVQHYYRAGAKLIVN
jgi:DNA-binding MarR family transcriptional regulator